MEQSHFPNEGQTDTGAFAAGVRPRQGVEAETMAILKDCGCDMAQGYFISRETPLSGLLEYLRNDR